jgi:hypothetical protein
MDIVKYSGHKADLLEEQGLPPEIRPMTGTSPEQDDEEEALAFFLTMSNEIEGRSIKRAAPPEPETSDVTVVQLSTRLQPLRDAEKEDESLAAFKKDIEPMMSIERLFGVSESNEREEAAWKSRKDARSVLDRARMEEEAQAAAKARRAAAAATLSSRGPLAGGAIGSLTMSSPELRPQRDSLAQRLRAADNGKGPTQDRRFTTRASVVCKTLPGGWTHREVVQQQPGAHLKPRWVSEPAASPASSSMAAARGSTWNRTYLPQGASTADLHDAVAEEEADGRPRLPEGRPDLWESRSNMASVRDLLDGYAANPLSPSPHRRCRGVAHSTDNKDGRPDSSFGFLEGYVERQKQIERLLATAQPLQHKRRYSPNSSPRWSPEASPASRSTVPMAGASHSRRPTGLSRSSPGL